MALYTLRDLIYNANFQKVDPIFVVPVSSYYGFCSSAVNLFVDFIFQVVLVEDRYPCFHFSNSNALVN